MGRERSYERYFPKKAIDTIQPELRYEETPNEFVQRLERKIQSELAKRYAICFRMYDRYDWLELRMSEAPWKAARERTGPSGSVDSETSSVISC